MAAAGWPRARGRPWRFRWHLGPGRSRTTRQGPRRRHDGSENFVHVENHGARLARAAAERQDAIEPGGGGMRRLEPQARTEVIEAGIDRLAAPQPRHDVGRPMAQAVAGNEDARAVRGLDRVARLEMRDAVLADDLPVGAARQDPAVEPCAVHAAAQNVDDAALAIGRVAEQKDIGKLGVDAEDGLGREHYCDGFVPSALAKLATAPRCASIEAANSLAEPGLTTWPVAVRRVLISGSLATARMSAVMRSRSSAAMSGGPNRPTRP